MKIMNRTRLMAVLLTGTLLGLGSLSANATAVGTQAGTKISNMATVDYNVGAVAQPQIKSSPDGATPTGVSTDFVVDAKLALVVTAVDSAEVAVSPGQTATVLTYKVANSGNDTRGVILTAGQLASTTATPFASGLKDNFDTTAVVRVSKTPNTAATYSAANDTASSIPQLASGDYVYVYVVSTIPTTQIDKDLAVLSLTGQIAEKGAAATYGSSPGAASVDQSGTAWTAGTRTALNIFADAAGSDDLALDGKSSARSAYIVKSASLTVAKTAKVLTDPVFCTTAGNPGTCTAGAKLHSIPGAVMQYSISIANAAGAASAATSIALSDDLSSQIGNLDLTSVASSMQLDPDGTGAVACGSPTCTFTSNKVAASVATLAAGKTAVLTFNVTIK